jgi:hypothetical protein
MSRASRRESGKFDPRVLAPSGYPRAHGMCAFRFIRDGSRKISSRKRACGGFLPRVGSSQNSSDPALVRSADGSTCGARHALRDDKGLAQQPSDKPFPLTTQGAMAKFFRYLLIGANPCGGALAPYPAGAEPPSPCFEAHDLCL